MKDRARGRTGAILLAAGILSLSAGLGLSPAMATGEFTTVALTSPGSGTSTTFTWSYTFHDNGGHELSNVAISFCSQSILDSVVSASPNAEIYKDSEVPGGHTGFGHGIKFGVTNPTGNLSVTFSQAHALGPDAVFVQSHSGDGQEGDIVKTGDGPSCGGTTTTTVPQVTTTVPQVTTTLPQVTTTVPQVTTTVPHVTTTVPQVTTTVPQVTTTVPQVTTTLVRVTTSVPLVTTTLPAVTTTLPGATTTSAVATTAPGGVLGVSERNTVPGDVAGVGGSLARTGGAALPLLVGLGLVLSIIGTGVLVGEYVGRPAD